MKIGRLLIVVGIAWALQAMWFWYLLGWLGFPDGALTDLARVRKQLYPVLIAVCAVASIVSLALAYKTSRSGASRAGKAALLALPIATALLWAIDRSLAAWFDDGGGG